MWHDHLVICGLNSVAAYAAEAIGDASYARDQILVIDCDPAKAEMARQLGFSFILGDATSPHTLRVAQVSGAAVVLVCVDDTDVLPIIEHIHSAAPRTPIKVVLKDNANREAALLSGATEVYVPSRLAGILLANSAMKLDRNT